FRLRSPSARCARPPAGLRSASPRCAKLAARRLLTRGDPRAEPVDLVDRRAERELELLGPQAVTMQRVVDVDAHAAVQVLRREAHAVTGVACPDLRDRDLVARRPL